MADQELLHGADLSAVTLVVLWEHEMVVPKAASLAAW